MATPDVSFASRRALQLVQEYGIASPSEIELDDIAFALGARVHRVQKGRYEGCLIRLDKHGWITINVGHGNLGRERFTLGHEIGHWVMHPQIGQLELCTTGDIQRYSGSAREIEANVFSAELLMPTPFIKPIAENGTFGFKLVDAVARDFRCSVTAAALRVSRFSKEKTVVVMSSDDQVQWSFPGRGTGEYAFRIARGKAVSDESRAYDCAYETRESLKIVPREAWFDYLGDDSRVTVYEGSRYNETLDTVLTLLVVHDD